MPHYETMVLLHPDINDADLPAMVAEIQQAVTGAGGTITKEEPLGKKKLAFEINHLRQGIYHLVEFDAPGTAVAALDQAFKLKKQVVRHMTVSVHVRTPEDIEREETLRAKIEAKRRAAAVATEVAALPKVEPKPEAPAEVSRQELDAKLESILDEDLMK